jgi:hypothetical protein
LPPRVTERAKHHFRAKSRDLLVPIMGTRRTESLIQSIWDIERIGDVRKLRRLLMSR